MGKLASNIMADLMDDLVGWRGPMTMRFFTPTEKFWQMLEPWRDEPVIEFGSGRGDIVLEGLERGFRISGCDLSRPSPRTAGKVHNFNALRFPLAPNMSVLICRPDHSGWCEPAMVRALEQGCEVAYVGLPENIERDMGDLYARRGAPVMGVGEEGECCWLFSPADLS